MSKIITINILSKKNIAQFLLLFLIVLSPLYAVEVNFTTDKHEVSKGDKFTLTVEFIPSEDDKNCHLFAYNAIKNNNKTTSPTFFESYLNSGDLKFEGTKGTWLYVSPSDGETHISTMTFSVTNTNELNLVANIKTYDGTELGLSNAYQSTKRCKVSHINSSLIIESNKPRTTSGENEKVFAEPEKITKLNCEHLRKSVNTENITNKKEQDEITLQKLLGESRKFYASECKDRGSVAANQLRDRNSEPEELSTQSTAILNTTKKQLGNIRSRLNRLRTTGGKRGVDVSGASLNIQGATLSAGLLGGAAGDNELLENSRWGVFTNGDYGFGHKRRQGDHLIRSGDRGFDFHSVGLTVGADYRFPQENIIAGGAIGYKNFDSDFTSQEGGTNTKGVNFNAYGTYLITDQSYFDAVLGYGKDQINSRRPVNNDGSGGVSSQTTFAISKPKAKTLSLSAGGGYEFTKQEWSLTPYGRVDYSKVTLDAFTESPSDLSATASMLKINKQKTSSLASTLGVKTSRVISTSKGVLIPHASLEWQHQLNQKNAISGHSVFPGDSSSFTESDRSEDDKNSYHLGFGLSAVLPEGRSTYLSIESKLGNTSETDHVVKAGFRWEFGLEHKK
ncbi:MAG: autotransporter outer membrane beta-barrel domain-containing protein [Cocleimonas sp.]|nr:autotransporter outer membrane beta-barrel domain-containing protein [Cocleimonas sp.]